MSSAREMRLRIQSVKNIAQVTKALETVSASKVRRATNAYQAAKPYADKAWKLLVHLARQPGRSSTHPLLQERTRVNKLLVVVVSSDRGLSGAYNNNILRYTLEYFSDIDLPVSYVAVGRKGRDMLIRRRKNVIADFSNLPPAPTFTDVSAIGRLIVDDFLGGLYDQVFIAYTEFISILRQTPVITKLLPLEVVYSEEAASLNATHPTHSVFTYEPEENMILGQIVPRFTAVQIFRCILSAAASEHAARMIAMRNATENAQELMGLLQLDYNKARQQTITNEMLDITTGAEALTKIQSLSANAN
jgi:F-type H+-transporting ATPase subunit gamma